MKINSKTLLFVGVVLAFFISSCTKDDIPENFSLVSKITTIYDDGYYVITDYNYNKNGLESIITTQSDTNGIFISKYVYSYDSESRISEVFKYEDNKLRGKQVYSWGSSSFSVWDYTIDEKGTWIEKDEMIKYDLNIDGKIVVAHTYNKIKEGEWIEQKYTSYEWINYNLAHTSTYEIKKGEHQLMYSYDYEYDDKFNPLLSTGWFYMQNLNNETMHSHDFYSPKDSEKTNIIKRYSYEYDENGLPVKRSVLGKDSVNNAENIISYFEYAEK